MGVAEQYGVSRVDRVHRQQRRSTQPPVGTMAGVGINGPVCGYLPGPVHALCGTCMARVRSPMSLSTCPGISRLRGHQRRGGRRLAGVLPRSDRSERVPTLDSATFRFSGCGITV